MRQLVARSGNPKGIGNETALKCPHQAANGGVSDITKLNNSLLFLQAGYVPAIAGNEPSGIDD
jgi:hypothetical protein